MKNTKALTMIVISVLLGLAAVVLAARWLTQQASGATEKVAVAARDIDLGSRLTPDMLLLVDWPKAAIPKGAFNNTNGLAKDPKTGEARVINTNLARGEPILESRLAPLGTMGGLSSLIPEGKRAITVRVNEVMGVAGFALPGSYVDILVNTQDERNNPIAKIILEHIPVLAVAQEVKGEGKPKVVNAVTLEVTPEEAEKIDLARTVGNLSLILRNEIDKTPVVTSGARKPSMLQTESGPAQKDQAKTIVQKEKVIVYRNKPAAASQQVEIIKGVQKSTERF